MSKPHIRYFGGTKNGLYKKIITIIWNRETSDNGKDKVNFGFSICHPKDQFNKKTGCAMASEEISTIYVAHEKKNWEIENAILYAISLSENVPLRLMRDIERGYIY